MKTHNFDFAYIGLTCARLGSQLKENYNLNLSATFDQNGNRWSTVSILQAPALVVVRNFLLAEFDSPQSFLDSVFAYCLENDLFKQPLDIKLVD